MRSFQSAWFFSHCCIYYLVNILMISSWAARQSASSTPPQILLSTLIPIEYLYDKTTLTVPSRRFVHRRRSGPYLAGWLSLERNPRCPSSLKAASLHSRRRSVKSWLTRTYETHLCPCGPETAPCHPKASLEPYNLAPEELTASLQHSGSDVKYGSKASLSEALDAASPVRMWPRFPESPAPPEIWPMSTSQLPRPGRASTTRFELLRRARHPLAQTSILSLPRTYPAEPVNKLALPREELSWNSVRTYPSHSTCAGCLRPLPTRLPKRCSYPTWTPGRGRILCPIGRPLPAGDAQREAAYFRPLGPPLDDAASTNGKRVNPFSSLRTNLRGLYWKAEGSMYRKPTGKASEAETAAVWPRSGKLF